MSKPLKQLLEEFEQYDLDGYEQTDEMSRRLRVLDEYTTKAASRGGIWISRFAVKRILDGEEP